MVSSSESRVAGLTAKRLDPLSMAMLAISHQGVDSSVSDTKVRALMVRTGEARGGYSLGCFPSAFHLTPGTHRQRRWPYTRRGSGGESTGGAIVWGAGLEVTLGCRVDGPSS